jgi:xanthine dehydrogenase accessory factor
MKELLSLACALLDQGKGFVIAKIVSRSGSTPRTAGARMLVTPGGGCHGTIGGGRLEAETISSSRELWETGGSGFLRFDLNNTNLSEMDMICGGVLEVLLDRVAATEENRCFFHDWRRMADEGRAGWAITAIHGNGRGIERITRCLRGADAPGPGSALPEQALEAAQRLAGEPAVKTNLTLVNLDDARVIVEPLVPPKTVFIFGAGHVARPTAHLAALMGFQVAVFDDREAYANARRFPEAGQIGILDDFDHALAGLPLDGDSYIVILTRGHLHDKTVLAQALRSKAGYIGMIGSRRKRDAIYHGLLEEGFTDRDLKRVFAPIGLAIGAESPEEIGLSIVAELVRQRAGA